MKIRSIAAAAALLSAAASPAGAALDGTQPLMCAPTDIVSCEEGRPCGKETPASLNVPPVLRLDLAKGQITGTRPNGAALAAAIDKVQHVEQRMVLQGVESGVMWGMLIAEDSGEMTLTAAGEKVGFVAFGTCAPD